MRTVVKAAALHYSKQASQPGWNHDGGCCKMSRYRAHSSLHLMALFSFVLPLERVIQISALLPVSTALKMPPPPHSEPIATQPNVLTLTGVESKNGRVGLFAFSSHIFQGFFCNIQMQMNP
jgi:hypothetical protein